MFSFRTGVLAIAGLFFVASPVRAQVMYTITDLGLPTNSTFNFRGTVASSVNDTGQVAGTALGNTGPPGPNRAFRFSPGPGMIELGSLQSNGSSVGRAINTFGQVAGETSTVSGDRAFRYTDGVGMVDLGVLSGFSNSSAYGINDLGQVVGQSVGPGITIRPFRYTDGLGMENLGLPPGMSFATARAINNSGQIAVQGSTETISQAYRYSDATGYVNLGTLGGTDALSQAINAAGDIVGASDLASGVSHAVLCPAAGGMIDLGVLPGGTSSGAFDLNDLGMIVGTSESSTGLRAFLYRSSTGIIDLNSLIDPGSGWTLNRAEGINELGQIVGTGRFGGFDERAFLLTPIPEPSSMVLVSLLMGIATVLRRRSRSMDVAFARLNQ